ncbi:MAG: DUF1573 domain-containing protein [Cyclobacteriaceae bacterium]
MRKLLLFVFMFSSWSLFAQPKTVEFLSTEHDFGILKEDDGPVEYVFQFINMGIDSVFIKSVRASCGCTTSGWSQNAILPGDTGYVKAMYNPLNRPGMFNKNLKVTTNANPAVYILQIKGSVLPKPRDIAEEYPNKIGSMRTKYQSLHMGKMITKNPVTRSFPWVNDSQQQIVFADSTVAPDFIKVSFQPDTLKSKEKGAVAITYDPIAKNDYGFVTDQITIYSNDTLQPIKNIKVVASIEEYFAPMTEKELKKAPRIEFLEKNHDFGHVRKGKQIVSTFRFANTGKSELSIRKIETNCQCVLLDSIPVMIDPGKEFSIKSHFDTSGRYGTQQKTITVFSNDPLNPINVLTIKGRIESN